MTLLQYLCGDVVIRLLDPSSLGQVLAAPSPEPLNPEPSPPPGGVLNSVTMLFSWLRWFTLVAIFACGGAGIAAMVAGRSINNSEWSKNGQRMIYVSIVCAVLFVSLHEIIQTLAEA